MSSNIGWPGVSGVRALVTGGSRGIGREIAGSLGAAGASVLLTARTEEAAGAAAAEIRDAGGDASGLALDLAESEATERAMQDLVKASREQGAIGLVVLNAGITRDGLSMRTSLDAWNEVLRVNLTGAFLVTRALLPGMIRARHGRIVAISSVVANMGNPGQANYAASKAGLHGFVRSIAREVGSRGITCNAVAPGYIDTDMTRDLPEAAREKLMEHVPLGRLGQPSDVAAATMFLLSDLAGYVTGEVLNVNGGMDM